MDVTNKTSQELVSLQTDIINNHKNYAETTRWTEQAKAVQLSIQGNKFPIQRTEGNRVAYASWEEYYGKSTKRPVYANFIKRQWRLLSNYLKNNEPKYIIGKGTFGNSNADLVATRALLDEIFEQKGTMSFGEHAPFSKGFWSGVLNKVIDYALIRGFCPLFLYFDANERKFRFKVFDPKDVFYKLNTMDPEKTEAFLFTYIKTRGEMVKDYPNVKDDTGKTINWNDEKGSPERSETTIIGMEPQDKDQFLIREGYYLDYEDISTAMAEDSKENENENPSEENPGNNPEDPTSDYAAGTKITKTPIVYRIVSTRNQLLSKEKLEDLTFIPVLFYIPLDLPDTLLPRSWFADAVEMERQANIAIQQLATIAKTSGRYVFIPRGTKITKSVNSELNRLGIEVFEFDKNQQLPQQADLLKISQDLITTIQFFSDQIEKECGMLSELMGQTSQQDMSGRAIMALQAGSKNNIGPALDNLNEFVTNVTKMVLKMYQIYGDEMSIYTNHDNLDTEVKVTKQGVVNTSVRVEVQAKSAFDLVAEQANNLEALKLMKEYNPDLIISPETITGILGVTNPAFTQLSNEILNDQNPDVAKADAENRQMLAGIPLNANAGEDHDLHYDSHNQLIMALDPNSPIVQIVMAHNLQHEANIKARQAMNDKMNQAQKQNTPTMQPATPL